MDPRWCIELVASCLIPQPSHTRCTYQTTPSNPYSYITHYSPTHPPTPNPCRLDVSGCANLGDRSLAAVARLPHLACLNLCGCKGFTNAGVARLAEAPALTELNLAHSSVTDVGSLAGLPKLRALNIFGCKLGSVPAWAQPGSPHSVARGLGSL